MSNTEQRLGPQPLTREEFDAQVEDALRKHPMTPRLVQCNQTRCNRAHERIQCKHSVPHIGDDCAHAPCRQFEGVAGCLCVPVAVEVPRPPTIDEHEERLDELFTLIAEHARNINLLLAKAQL